MRYSILGFSQEKMLEYKLDPIDALLLDWFQIFFTGKMEKMIVDDNGKQKIFGWVKISKVLEDLPCLGINSEKGIKRRFDVFVEKNILERKTVQKQSGKRSFYKATELFESLINTIALNNNKSENKVNEKSHNNNLQIQNTVNSDNTKTLHIEENKQNKNNNVKNGNGVSQDYENILAKKTTIQKSSQDYENILAEGNQNILADNHENILALNDYLIKDYVVKDTAAISSYKNKYFGENYFDSLFDKKAAAFFSQNNIKNVELYFKFIKNKVAKKCEISGNKLANPRNYAYKLFFQTDIAKEFEDYEQIQAEVEKLNKVKEIENEKRKVTCPCCSNRFIKTTYIDNCPHCEFSLDKFTNDEEISEYKRYLVLPEPIKVKYTQEICSFKSELSFVQKVNYLKTDEGKQQQLLYETNIKKKYGIIV